MSYEPLVVGWQSKWIHCHTWATLTWLQRAWNNERFLQICKEASHNCTENSLCSCRCCSSYQRSRNNHTGDSTPFQPIWELLFVPHMNSCRCMSMLIWIRPCLRLHTKAAEFWDQLGITQDADWQLQISRCTFHNVKNTSVYIDAGRF